MFNIYFKTIPGITPETGFNEFRAWDATQFLMAACFVVFFLGGKILGTVEVRYVELWYIELLPVTNNCTIFLEILCKSVAQCYAYIELMLIATFNWTLHPSSALLNSTAVSSYIILTIHVDENALF